MNQLHAAILVRIPAQQLLWAVVMKTCPHPSNADMRMGSEAVCFCVWAVQLEVVEAMSNQTQLRSSSVDQITAIVEELPHDTHHITAMPGNRYTIYCKSCACWSLRSKLRGLASRCEGLKSGNASSLRLLQCGVEPEPAARLPPQQVKRRARRCRL